MLIVFVRFQLIPTSGFVSPCQALSYATSSRSGASHPWPCGFTVVAVNLFTKSDSHIYIYNSSGDWIIFDQAFWVKTPALDHDFTEFRSRCCATSWTLCVCLWEFSKAPGSGLDKTWPSNHPISSTNNKIRHDFHHAVFHHDFPVTRFAHHVPR